MKEAHICIYTFGKLSVERKRADGTWETVAPLTQGPVTHENHTKSVLGYLLCCCGRRALRGQIALDLWGSESVSGEEYLQKATTRLRRLLGGEPSFQLTENKKRYALADQSQIWTDRDHCIALMAEVEEVGRTTRAAIARLEEAERLFRRGAFLEEEASSWFHAPRGELTTLFYRCRQYLVEVYQTQGMYPQEERIAEAWLREDPFDETALRHLMQAMQEQEMTHEAQRRYRETAALAKKMGHELSSEMEAFARQLSRQPRRQGVPSTAETPPSPSPQPLVSRPSFNVSSQGIISGEPDGQQLNARNLKSSYLALSTDIMGSLKAYSSLCQGGVATCRQQIDIYETIEQRNTMNDKPITDLSQIRRRDLLTLAIISQPLLTNIRRGWLTAGVIEDFLSETTASVTTCWYLLQRSDGLPLVEFTLPQYLPELVEVVKFSSSYRQRASYLAAQGFLLLSLVAHHRVRYAERVVHCQKAVMYASESGDLTLLLTSLGHLGDAFLINERLDESLKTYQQAEGYSKSTKVSGFLRSKILAELSHPYAQQGNGHEAVLCLSEAYATFAEADSETPIFLLTDYGLFQTILFEGLSALDLGNHAQNLGNFGLAQKYYDDAAEKFGKIEQLPSGIIVPARLDVEIEINRAKAAALAGDMDEFIKRFENGVRGAKELGSEKRMQEAREAYMVARKRWPHEQRIIDLWELLI